MPSDLTKRPFSSFNVWRGPSNQVPFLRKEKNGASDFVLPNKRPLPFSASFVLHPPPRLRGQGSVEYLFVVVFLVGFIVAVLVPSLQTAEITYALAGARTAAVGYETNQTDIRLTRMNYSVDHDQVRLVLTVYNRSADANIAAPQGLKDAVLSGIHVLAPTYGVNGSCANTSNYEYCVVS